jgi:hypothetical protein
MSNLGSCLFWTFDKQNASQFELSCSKHLYNQTNVLVRAQVAVFLMTG